MKRFSWVIVLILARPMWADPLLDQGYGQMYNLKFAEAHRTFTTFEQQHPNDPLGPVSDAAAYLFSEFDRLHILQSEFFVSNQSFLDFKKPTGDPVVKQRFEADLDKTQKLADAELRRSPDDPDALFASTLRLGLHADYVALIDRHNLAALSEIKQGREMAQKLLAAHPDYYDAYIAGGVENYLLSLKPAPVRWLLHAGGAQTDRQTGIDKLTITAEKGHYLLPYARLLLAVAALRDNDHTRARTLLQWLSDRYPGNRLYKEELEKIKRS